MYHRPFSALTLAASISSDLTFMDEKDRQTCFPGLGSNYGWVEMFCAIGHIADHVFRQLLECFVTEEAFYEHWNEELNGGVFAYDAAALACAALREYAADGKDPWLDEAFYGIATRTVEAILGKEDIPAPAANNIASILGVPAV